MTFRSLVLASTFLLATSAGAQANQNLAREGWYADPEIHIFAGQYWIYPTSSPSEGARQAPRAYTTEQAQLRSGHIVHPSFLLQTSFDAFSSPDLVHWTRHTNVLDIKDVPWAAYAVWAPSAIELGGHYYLLFGANDIQERDHFAGGIGLAESSSPAGPFKNALGKPLIGEYHHGAQPIDPMVFRDDDGALYLYYGGHGHCVVTRLAPDLTHVLPLPNGEAFKEITPEHYVEGPFMLKRKRIYYFMWSEGDWGDASYGVAYAKSTSPIGPFQRIGKILSTDPSIATGPGHHSVLHIPGTDDYYIAYHRHPLGTAGADQRVLAIDRLRFDANGNIEPVHMTADGPRALPVRSLSLHAKAAR